MAVSSVATLGNDNEKDYLLWMIRTGKAVAILPHDDVEPLVFPAGSPLPAKSLVLSVAALKQYWKQDRPDTPLCLS